ncbi:hypothetical protein [Streptomyces sp. RerS4]|uniref:hypothetical protein n=1 Tax=Streptomyces sp. RerS4 TaxID=2942449 RepID=UPI00201C34C1|nr:hypothetical protein [Streptomyces sp. RerS4]UQW99193.1 hypothetical protein M4D82_00535 [Streptomyces sp. RerS4]
MHTTIATRVETGSFFDLDRSDPALIQLREDDAERVLPFALMERLVKSGTPYAEHARALRSDPVHVAGARFDWYTAALPAQIADEINLTDYEIVEHTDERRTSLTRALERLATVHPDGFARVREFVRGVLWVGLKPGVRTSSLTSSSDPALPYVIVFSEKAQHHIPPNTVRGGRAHPRHEEGSAPVIRALTIRSPWSDCIALDNGKRTENRVVQGLAYRYPVVARDVDQVAVALGVGAGGRAAEDRPPRAHVAAELHFPVKSAC